MKAMCKQHIQEIKPMPKVQGHQMKANSQRATARKTKFNEQNSEQQGSWQQPPTTSSSSSKPSWWRDGAIFSTSFSKGHGTKPSHPNSKVQAASHPGGGMGGIFGHP